jgi:hypothetical protein
MPWAPGSRNDSWKHCDSSNYLAKRARAQAGACAEVQFPDYGTVFCPLTVEYVQGKHCDFCNYLAKRARDQSGACAEVQFPDYGKSCGPLTAEMVQGNTEISAPILPREREISLAHAQRCSFLFMEQCCGPLAVEIIPGKNCDFSIYLTKRARTHSGACVELQFPDYGTVLWSHGSRNFSRKALRFQHLSCQECERSLWSMPRGAVY